MFSKTFLVSLVVLLFMSTSALVKVYVDSSVQVTPVLFCDTKKVQPLTRNVFYVCDLGNSELLLVCDLQDGDKGLYVCATHEIPD